VNIAARLEALAEPGGICVSGTVRDHIGDRLDLAFNDMGERSLKNIARPVRIYRVRDKIAAAESPAAPASPTLPWAGTRRARFAPLRLIGQSSIG
jgi:adenylate cyclase